MTSIASLQKAVCSFTGSCITKASPHNKGRHVLVGCGIYSFTKEVSGNEVSLAPHRIRPINNNFMLFPGNNSG